jgi:hypothetical protein
MDIYADDDFSYYTSVDKQLATQGIFRSGEKEDRCDLEPVISFAHKTVQSFFCAQSIGRYNKQNGIGSVSSKLYGFKPNSCK